MMHGNSNIKLIILVQTRTDYEASHYALQPRFVWPRAGGSGSFSTW